MDANRSATPPIVNTRPARAHDTEGSRTNEREIATTPSSTRPSDHASM
jgi:hypothetical protein